MKIIFLDIDGVLNSFRNVAAFKRFPFPGLLENHPESAMGPESELDPVAIGMIRSICDSENVDIVLHSTWRKTVDAIELGKRLNLPIIDNTHPALEKAQGIALWLSEAKEPVTHFAIIDDDDIFAKSGMGSGTDLWKKMKECHIKTSMVTGFTFMDFVNTFLLFSENDIDDIREKVKRSGQLRAINAMKNDTRTEAQRKEDEEELRELVKELNKVGNWSVAVMLELTEDMECSII